MPRSFLDRGPLTVALGLLVLVLTSSEAQSQAKPMAARVSELEQRIKKLEARLDAVEKRAGAGAERAAVARFPSPSDECNPAFVIDGQGIRRIKAECLDRAPRCDPPYTIDERGFRVPKPECL